MKDSRAHLFFGESAAGSYRSVSPTANVYALRDNLTVGPLPEHGWERNRAAFWRSILESEEAPPSDSATLKTFVANSGTLVLWIGAWAIERLGMMFAISHLRDLGISRERLKVVDLRTTACALLPPKELAANLSHAKEMPSAWWDSPRLWDLSAPPYRWHAASVPSLPTEFNELPTEPVFAHALDVALCGDHGEALDAFLRNAATADWSRAARIVGNVLARAPFGDRIVHARLRKLCRKAKLEARGDLAALRSFEVRLPH